MKTLLNIKDGDLKTLFDLLEQAFGELGIDYYMIGAIARDTWYTRKAILTGGTKDVDFAVMVGSETAYNDLKKHLEKNYGFQTTKENAYALQSPNELQLDILPFGDIEIDDGIKVEGTGLTSIKVNGFMEVYASGTKAVQLSTGHLFQVATLSSIVLLKLIAYDDRPEKRSKDPRDIGNIIQHYFDLEADLIYGEHYDLYLDDQSERSNEEISSIVIGREIAKLLTANDVLKQRILNSLQQHAANDGDNAFIHHMADGTKKEVLELVNWMNLVAYGMMHPSALANFS